MSMAYNWAACSDVKPLNLEILKRTFPTRKVLKLGMFSSPSSCTDRGQGDKNAGNTCIVIFYPSIFWNVFQEQRDPGAGDQQSQSTLSVSTNLACLGHLLWRPRWETSCGIMVVFMGPFLPPFFSLSPESWETKVPEAVVAQGSSNWIRTGNFWVHKDLVLSQICMNDSSQFLPQISLTTSIIMLLCQI